MNVDEITIKYKTLNNQLKEALSRMEHTDKVYIIKEAIIDLQHICPHDNGNYDFSNSDVCPYCGKIFRK